MINSEVFMFVKNKTMKKNIILIFAICLSINLIAENQEEKETHILSFNEFFQNVMLNNLDLITEQYDVSIAEAAVVASRIFPDPEVEMLFHVFEDESFNGFQPTIEIEMELPIELFGKRRFRIRQAQAEAFAARARLDDFLRYLRAESAAIFATALNYQSVIETMNIILDELNQLAEANKERYQAGEIGRMELIQTQLEVSNYMSEIFLMQTEFYELLSDVYFMIGGIPADSLIFSGSLDIDPPLIFYDRLKEQTLNTRADIRFAEKMTEAAEHSVRLARAERLPDMSLMGGFNNENSRGIKAAYLGLVIPLKFSGFNRGQYEISYYEREQSRLFLEATLLEAEIELKQTYNKFLLMTRKKNLFTETILVDAQTVKDAAIYSYERGESSLLEVLEAQRTMNEIYMNYYDALLQYALSIIELSKASGEWFVEL